MRNFRDQLRGEGRGDQQMESVDVVLVYLNCRSVKVKDLSPQNKVKEWVQTLPTASAGKTFTLLNEKLESINERTT